MCLRLLQMVTLVICSVHCMGTPMTTGECQIIMGDQQGELVCSVSLHNGSECSVSYLKERYRDLYDADIYPAKPSEFEVSLYENRSENFLCPGVTLKMKPTRVSSRIYVRGFHVNLDLLNEDTRFCLVLTIDKGNISEEKTELEFNVNLWPLGNGTANHYRLQCFSLPKPKVTEQEDTYIEKYLTTSISRTVSASSDKWTTSIVFNNVTTFSRRKVEMLFLKAPLEYNFTEYNIELLRKNGDPSSYQQKISVTDPKLNFENIEEPGFYRISVTPITDAASNCQCKNEIGDCVVCISTLSQTFSLFTDADIDNLPTFTTTDMTETSEVTSTELTTTPPSGHHDHEEREITTKSLKKKTNIEAIIPAVVVIIILLGFTIAVVVFVCRKSDGNRHINCASKVGTCPWLPWLRNTNQTITDPRHVDGHPPQQVDCQRQNRAEEKTVYLVYAEDNDDHVQAIHLFATILKKYCHCNMLYHPWFSREVDAFRWAVSSLSNADITILVGSRSAYDQYQSWKYDHDINVQDHSPTGDHFLVALRQVSRYIAENPCHCRRFVTVYFEYTRQEFLPGEIGSGGRYRIVEHFEDLLCYIHNVNKSELKYLLKKIDIWKTVDGKNFLEKVKNASKHEQSYDSGIMRSVSVPSEDLKIVQTLYTDNAELSATITQDNFVIPPEVIKDLDSRDQLDSVSVYPAMTIMEGDFTQPHNFDISHQAPYFRHEAEVHCQDECRSAEWDRFVPQKCCQNVLQQNSVNLTSPHHQSDVSVGQHGDDIPHDIFLPPDPVHSEFGDTESQTQSECMKQINNNYLFRVRQEKLFPFRGNFSEKVIEHENVEGNVMSCHNLKGPDKSRMSSSQIRLPSDNGTKNKAPTVISDSSVVKSEFDRGIPLDLFLPPDSLESDTCSQTQSEYMKQINDNYMAKQTHLSLPSKNKNGSGHGTGTIDRDRQHGHFSGRECMEGHLNDGKSVNLASTRNGHGQSWTFVENNVQFPDGGSSCQKLSQHEFKPPSVSHEYPSSCCDPSSQDEWRSRPTVVSENGRLNNFMASRLLRNNKHIELSEINLECTDMCQSRPQVSNEEQKTVAVLRNEEPSLDTSQNICLDHLSIEDNEEFDGISI